ncbi:MAG: hypothetical protein JXR40_13505 [Pontiellaceae bacterium]|nr:hypothetical protein [Pontiellaceae bacterium]
MKKSELLDKINQSKREGKKEGANFFVKVFSPMLVVLIFAMIFFEGEEESSLLLKIGATALLVVMLVSILYFAHQSEQVQNKIRAKTPCCNSGIFPMDIKIIIASRHCPYCGEEIITEHDQPTEFSR